MPVSFLILSTRHCEEGFARRSNLHYCVGDCFVSPSGFLAMTNATCIMTWDYHFY